MAEYNIQMPDGSSYHIQADTDQQAQAAINDLVGKPQTSVLESAGRGALNNFPLAKQAASAVMPGNYSENLANLSQEAQTAKASHPIAYGAGATAGAMAPALIPGVGTAAGAAALGAAQGVSDTDLVKNPGEAVKNAAIGGVLGSVLHGVMPTGEKTAEGLENYANTKTVQSLGMRPGNLGVTGEEVQNLGNMAHEMGLDKGSLEDRTFNAKNLLDQTGKQIEDLGQGKVLKDATPFQQALGQHMNESAQVLGFEGNPEVKMYQKAADNLRPGMTFEQLQTLKDNYAQRAFDSTGGVKNDVAYNIWKQVTDAQQSLAADHPEYPELKQAYSQLKDMHEGLQTQLQKEQSSGVQAKGFGLAGKMGAMVTGGNVPATLGLATALAPVHPFMAMGAATGLITNPEAMASAARGLSNIAEPAAQAIKAGSIDAVTSSIMNAIHTNPKSLGKFAQPLMQAAQTGGNQGIAATHFLLSQQYPEYNKMMMKQSEFGKKPEEDENAQ